MSHLQYVTGKGFVSPVYKTTSAADGTFVFDLSKPVTNRLGATGEFQLAGDPKLSIRTWAENPDPTKYTIIKSGDHVQVSMVVLVVQMKLGTSQLGLIALPMVK